MKSECDSFANFILYDLHAPVHGNGYAFLFEGGAHGMF